MYYKLSVHNVSTREEIEVGTQADVAIRKEYGVYPDETLQLYVQDVGKNS